jgi:hypothetical protein
MSLDRIRQHFAQLPAVPLEIARTDLTRGETEESFIVRGEKNNYSDVYEFAAAALSALSSYRDESLQELEVEEYAKPWMHALDPTLRPGDRLCLPVSSVLGFDPPRNLKQRLVVAPNWSPVEECLVCEGDEDYVLLYWYTTG